MEFWTFALLIGPEADSELTKRGTEGWAMVNVEVFSDQSGHLYLAGLMARPLPKKPVGMATRG